MTSSPRTHTGSQKKILVPIFYRGHYGRLKPVLDAIKKHPKLELLVMTASQAAYRHFTANLRHSEPKNIREALSWYIRARMLGIGKRLRIFGDIEREHVIKKLREDGFSVHAQEYFFFDGGTPAVMAKSVGLGIMNIVDALRRLQPDMVFINADRFEMMAIAVAAAYLNIPIAHNEAGDVSGTIDESVRHAITKFAHMHFTSTDQSRARVIQMGESPDFVFTVGSPAIDAASRVDLHAESSVGTVDLLKPYLVVLLHPVTTESTEENDRGLRAVTDALLTLAMPTIIIGGNSDAQSDSVSKGIAEWYEEKKPPSVHFVKHLHPDRFYRVLARAACALGNSSSFIREGAFFGTPAVLIGSRQMRRERGANIIEVETETPAIIRAVRDQIAHGKFTRDTRFGDGKSAERIAEILAAVHPPIQKKFFDI